MTGEERKAAIVEAAIRLFSAKGFRGTTTRELAAAVGVTEPILYQHFATKRDLYRAIIESSMRPEHKDPDPQLEAARAAEDDRAFFMRMGDLLLAWYEDQPQMVRLLFFSALEGHELSDLFFEHKVVAYYQLLTEYLTRRMEKKAFRTADPLVAARAFTGMITHQGLLMTVWQCHALAGNRQEVLEEFVRIFLKGIKQRRSKTA
jgi:AcrR family transcriptional regulator